MLLKEDVSPKGLQSQLGCVLNRGSEIGRVTGLWGNLRHGVRKYARWKVGRLGINSHSRILSKFPIQISQGRPASRAKMPSARGSQLQRGSPIRGWQQHIKESELQKIQKKNFPNLINLDKACTSHQLSHPPGSTRPDCATFPTEGRRGDFEAASRSGPRPLPLCQIGGPWGPSVRRYDRLNVGTFGIPGETNCP